MPHQCTNCGHAFPDGSKEMLSGCPDCGGNKFQFKPAGVSDDQSTRTAAPSESSPSKPSTPEPSTSEPSPSKSSQSTPETAQSPSETKGVEDESGFVSKDLENPPESAAQSSARSDVVSSDELTAAGAAPSATDNNTDSASDLASNSASDSAPDQSVDQSVNQSVNQSVDQPTEDTEAEESNLHQLRKELNDQFESIRIVSPGQYELNLMELYDREEYIISLREDGRYVIEVPDGWGDS